MGWFGSGRTEEAKVPAPANTNAASAVAAEEYDVISEGFLRDIARLKGRAPVEGVPVLASVLYPVSAAIAADERKKEAARKKAEEEALKNPTPGQEIPGQGIFLGTWQPEGLSQKFNVFAAPEDLPDTMKYVEAVKHLAGRKGWHGHDGTNYATDKEFRQALGNGSYAKEGSGWIIPPRELLTGKDADGNMVQPDNLLAAFNKGVLKGIKTAASGSDYPDWYWSSTEYRVLPSDVLIVRFSDGNENWDLKDYVRLSCRPVRLVQVAVP
jgi:hypothetical protein